MRLRRIAVVVVAIFFVFMVAGLPADAASEEFWTDLSNLRPGMMGVGKTVISGTEIVDFDVEILAVLPNQGPVGDLILVRVSGDVIDKTDGIAAGMSGSPVYVDGKLLGAVGYGFALTDHRVGMVTPITSMLPVLDLAVAEAGPKPLVSVFSGHEIEVAGLSVEGQTIDRIIFDPDQWEQVPNSLVMVPVRTPLLVSGLGSRAMKVLSEGLEQFGLVPVQGAAGLGEEHEPLPFEPGSPVGVQLVRGDVDVTSLGTVTYRDDKGFIGFGHPFMNRGRSDFFATTALVYTTIPQLEMPFKIGSPGSVVGTLNQDRFAAVGGSFGDYPKSFPLRVTVRDKELVRRHESEMEVVQDELLSVNLVASSALEALDRGIDRIGPGTSRVVFRIEADGLPKPIVRDNMFFSDADVSAVSLVEMMEGLDILLRNEFKELGISKVDLDIQIEEKRLTATIEDVRAERTEVYPGESVNVEVTIRPFRGQPMTKIVRLDIPEGIQPGNVRVTVRGGGFGFLLPEETPFHERSGGSEGKGEKDFQTTTAQNLERLVEDFTKRERNNEIVVEFYPYGGYQEEVPVATEETTSKPAEPNTKVSPEGTTKEASENTPADEQEEAMPAVEDYSTEQPSPVKQSLQTGYVIQGMTGFDLNIIAQTNSDVVTEIQEDEAF